MGITPALLVEALSDGTEKYSRGEKFAHDRRLPTPRWQREDGAEGHA